MGLHSSLSSFYLEYYHGFLMLLFADATHSMFSYSMHVIVHLMLSINQEEEEEEKVEEVEEEGKKI